MTDNCKTNLCNLCGHDLVDNKHGFDQNDAWMDGDKLKHGGTCTYCKFCNPYGWNYGKAENGWTKDGQVARDYLDAGRDPDLPRPTMEDIQNSLEEFHRRDKK